MSVNLSEFNDASLILAAADAVLEDVAELPASRGFEFQVSNDSEFHGISTAVDSGIFEHSNDLASLGTRLAREFRKDALNIEEQLSTRGNFVLVPVIGAERGYSIARALRLNEQGQIESIVGAVVGDPHCSVLIDVESPLVFEVLARHEYGSVSDRVRVFSQLVRLYGDAIRFFGFRKCPLCDAVSVLRAAMRELRVEQSDNAGESTNAGEENR